MSQIVMELSSEHKRVIIYLTLQDSEFAEFAMVDHLLTFDLEKQKHFIIIDIKNLKLPVHKTCYMEIFDSPCFLF